MRLLRRAPALAVLAIAVVLFTGPDTTSALALAGGAPSASVPASVSASVSVSAGRLPDADAAQVEPGTTLPEAPSSITAKDQTRGALVLFATFAAMGVLVLFAVMGARRRRRRTPA